MQRFLTRRRNRKLAEDLGSPSKILAPSPLARSTSNQLKEQDASPSQKKPGEVSFTLNDEHVKRETKTQERQPVLEQLSPLGFGIESGVESWSKHIARLAKLTNEELLSEFTTLSSMKPCLSSHDEAELKLRLMMFWSLDNLDPIVGASRPGRLSVGPPLLHLAFHETQGN
jgi:hypothetical protein